MSKYVIDNEMIKKYITLDKEFNDINELCDYLLDNKLKVYKPKFKNLLLDLTKENREDRSHIQKHIFDENVIWLRENCIIGNINSEEVHQEETVHEKVKMEEMQIIPENDFEKIKNEYAANDYKKVMSLEDEDIDYTADIILHEGGIITQQDKYQIFISSKFDSKNNILSTLDLSKVLIVEAEGVKTLALGYLVKSVDMKNAYTLVFENRECIDYNSFKHISQARLILYTKDGRVFSRSIEMDYTPFEEERERPLCIDFGTSNTSVGSYGILDKKKDEAEIVKFTDVTVTPNNTEAVLLPTIVYVDDCSNPNDIKYLFGYEARRKIENEHYESKASVYFEIKRWISSTEEKEEVRDRNNNKATPFKKDIIKAYLDYVIESAEQYFKIRFKKIHFSAPVKLKEQFINVLTNLYKNEKEVLSVSESIDEGIAIVYNQIITLMKPDDGKGEVKKKNIVIMDCGGGTTDLASCEYQCRETNAGIELDLDTCFENGNSNFGGNNITYRIMQLLKIKIAAKLSENIIDNMGEAIKLIDKSENEILGLVEENMSQKRYDSDNADTDIYAKFLKNYQMAENVVPTQYVGNKKYSGTQSLKKIKRNFYYLWRKAEQIKIEFYNTERVLMDFKDTHEDIIIDINGCDNYYLYIDRDNELVKVDNPFNNVSITIKEINRVICADIYSLLVGLFENGELTSRKRNVGDFDYYKLSGQSCKISLFSELIKEYVPGRKLRPAIKHSNDNKKRLSEDLKMECILGCINYVKDQIRPEMNVTIKTGRPEPIYSVVLKGKHSDDKAVFDCANPNLIIKEVSHKNTREYPFMIVSKDGILEREFIFNLRPCGGKNDEIWSCEEIKKKILSTSSVEEQAVDKFISEIRESETNAKDTVNIVFAVLARHGYGVWIGQIQVSGDEDSSKYMMLQYEYENFEDSSKTFFDGKR